MDDQYVLLTFQDAANLAGVSRTTIRKWVDHAGLDAVKMPASANRRIRRSALIQFLNNLEEADKTEAPELMRFNPQRAI
ncbi:helix-turn-helix domain-containing protein [Crateriforma conspicua]|uniref:Helix-turn-helix domain protein n=1 Tax=Crateriforma conspicua TaxID=2527996 RepID=A0A5C5XQZ3_9PLAN|nr:helix-turn-helix domain-containing protein [Crateriforma conspicua]QDV66230.1 Helix-turn-helix domain protein [Crateriforma conspicua]TWT65636.1 Helix-turn-helix domain protein [Crateriforma conspicua]